MPSITLNSEKNDYGFGVYCVVSESSTSVSNNTSTCKYTVKVTTGSITMADDRYFKWTVKIGSTTKSGTVFVDYVAYGGTVTLATGNVTVEHDSNGDKTVSITAKLEQANGSTSWDHPWAINPSVSGSLTLTHINRQSTSSANTISLSSNDTETLTISTNRSTTTHTHTIVMTFGEDTQTFTDVGASVTYTVPVSTWLSYMPTSKTATGTLVTRTYNGGTQVGSTTESTFTVNVDSSVYKPVIGTVTHSDSNAITSPLHNSGAYIQGYSDLLATCSITHTDSSNTTIATVTCGSNSYTPGTASYSLSSTITGISASSFKITATDARGISTSVTTYITLLAYSKPTLYGDATRADMTSSVITTDFTVSYTNGFVRQANEPVLSYRYRAYGDESYTDGGTTYPLSTTDSSATTYTGTLAQTIATEMPYTTQYEVLFKITDSITESDELSVTIKKGIPDFTFRDDGICVFGSIHLHDKNTISEENPYVRVLYPIDTGWVTFDSATAGSYGSPQYRRIGEQVFLRGSISFTASSSSVTIGQVSANCVPPNAVCWFATCYGQQVARLRVTENGNFLVDWVWNLSSNAKVTSGSVSWCDISTSYFVNVD